MVSGAAGAGGPEVTQVTISEIGLFFSSYFWRNFKWYLVLSGVSSVNNIKTIVWSKK